MKSRALTFALVASLFGCGNTGTPCNTTADCADGQICVQGQCRGGSTTSGGGTGSTTGGSGGTTGGGSGGGSANSGGGSGNTGGGTGVVIPPDAGLTEPDAGQPILDGGCGVPDAGNPTIKRLCAPATTSECDGVTDTLLSTQGGVPSERLNGGSGNGFDDDCDGQVDEGCTCPSNGVTRDCYLVPATQVGAASGLPVGWCTNNAKGSLDCVGSEFSVWSGVCRGAQAPALNDTCSSGDFNCDGLDANNRLQGCACGTDDVQCPTASITAAPYPAPTAIPGINGGAWVKNGTATNWTWTVIGGDCDNVLPHPSYAVYGGANSNTASRLGSRTAVSLDGNNHYVPDTNSKLISIRATGASSTIYPAFGLSGDYIVQGEFDVNGTHYTCTQKVEVRAPGIRAELCWDTVGGMSVSEGNDIDLHFAELQNVLGCSTQGWFNTCNDSQFTAQDCYYADCARDTLDWGYADSASSACHGWSSKRSSTYACSNPRLDRDNVQCDRSIDDPTNADFCGPENINIDNPGNNDAFAVGVEFYDNWKANGSAGTSGTAHPHVNLYCNGQRVLSAGYNPATGQTAFPLMNTPGQTGSGDFWNVATIKANVSGSTLSSCTVTTLPSRVANTTRDGSTNICVDHAYANHNFIESGTGQGGTVGGQPSSATQWCKH